MLNPAGDVNYAFEIMNYCSNEIIIKENKQRILTDINASQTKKGFNKQCGKYAQSSVKIKDELTSYSRIALLVKALVLNEARMTRIPPKDAK